MRSLPAAGLGLLPFVPFFAAPLAAQSLLPQHAETMLASGMPMPSSGATNDFPAGAVMATTSPSQGVTVQPVLSADGYVVFRARARDDVALGIDGSNATAWLIGRGAGDLRTLVRQGDPAPGLPATTRLATTLAQSLPLRPLRIAPFGSTVVFGSGLADSTTPTNTPTTSDSAMFWGTPGNLQLLMREGTAVPTLGLARFGEIDMSTSVFYELNSAGTVVFRNRLQSGFGGVTTANDGLVMIGTPGNLQTLLREGDAWTGVGAAGEVIAQVPGGDYPCTFHRLNEAGQVLHDLLFQVGTGTATSTANDRALALWSGGVDTIVVREGDQAPGLPAGAVFADVAGSALFVPFGNCFGKDGSFVFLAVLPVGPGGVSAADDRALFQHVAGTTSLLISEGDPAPAALGAGVLWGSINGNLQRNDDGQLLLATSLGGAVTANDDNAVLVGVPGAFAVVLREGQAVPGMPGFTFADGSASVLAMTPRRHVLLFQSVTDGVQSFGAWFAWTPEHGLRLWYDPRTSWTTTLGTSTSSVVLGVQTGTSGDTTNLCLNADGDFAGQLLFQGADAAALGTAQVRGHLGALVATPASVPVAGGVPQTFALDAGPANGGRIYFLLASSLGTRPGFLSPLGPQTIPLNFDPLWTVLSIQAANSPIWVASIGITDPLGRGGPAAFVMPAGNPGFLGTTLHHAAVLFNGALVSTYVSEPAGVLLR